MLLDMSPPWLNRPRKRFAVLLAVLFWTTSTLFVKAQKAEAKRIEFPKGSSTTLLSGTLQGRQQMEYALGASGHQVLWLQLSATPPGSLSLQLRSPDYQAMRMTSAGLHKWRANLPENGDYEVWVVRENGEAPVSTFKLRVTIH
jgi:hypothetical protein